MKKHNPLTDDLNVLCTNPNTLTTHAPSTIINISLCMYKCISRCVMECIISLGKMKILVPWYKGI